MAGPAQNGQICIGDHPQARYRTSDQFTRDGGCDAAALARRRDGMAQFGGAIQRGLSILRCRSLLRRRRRTGASPADLVRPAARRAMMIVAPLGGLPSLS
jgi:hypothetical protein